MDKWNEAKKSLGILNFIFEKWKVSLPSNRLGFGSFPQMSCLKFIWYIFLSYFLKEKKCSSLTQFEPFPPFYHMEKFYFHCLGSIGVAHQAENWMINGSLIQLNHEMSFVKSWIPRPSSYQSWIHGIYDGTKAFQHPYFVQFSFFGEANHHIVLPGKISYALAV